MTLLVFAAGTFKPGEMLAEHDLAARLGVSRTPIRSALTRLEVDGWITIYPKRGALVRDFSAKDIADMADARVLLESDGIARAATAVRRRLGSELVELVDRQYAAFRERDIATFVELTLQFHHAFVAAGGNRLLVEICDHFADRQRQLLFAKGDEMLERSGAIIAEHRELLTHLRADDPAAFADALRAHVSNTLDTDAGPL